MQRLLLPILIYALTSGCTGPKAPLGTPENPLRFYLIPSVESAMLETSGEALKKYLESHTPYKFKLAVPTSYIAVVEAFGSRRADIASLNTYGYVLAHRKYKTEARLTVIRAGDSTYKGQIIAHRRSHFKSLKDLNGKRFAFVDPTSASGYVLPFSLLTKNKIKPRETVFAQRHDSVISMIYQGQVDAGAVYYSPPMNGEIQDARRLVRTQYPNVENDITVIQFTESIPNDCIAFRQDLDEKIKSEVSRALIDFVDTADGKKSLEDTFGVTGFKPSSDKDYDIARALFDEFEKLEAAKSEPKLHE